MQRCAYDACMSSVCCEGCIIVLVFEQARAEIYDEVICFIELLNTLLQSLTPAHVEQSAHFTQFVLADVFGQLHQRAYRCIPLPKG